MPQTGLCPGCAVTQLVQYVPFWSEPTHCYTYRFTQGSRARWRGPPDGAQFTGGSVWYRVPARETTTQETASCLGAGWLHWVLPLMEGMGSDVSSLEGQFCHQALLCHGFSKCLTHQQDLWDGSFHVST